MEGWREEKTKNRGRETGEVEERKDELWKEGKRRDGGKERWEMENKGKKKKISGEE